MTHFRGAPTYAEDLLDSLQVETTPPDSIIVDGIEGVIDKVMVFLPYVTLAVDLLEDAIAQAGKAKFPGGALITGEGGSGKSAILGQIVRRHPKSDTRLQKRCPAPYLKFRTRLTANQFLLVLLALLNHPAKSSDHRLLDTVIEAFKACAVKILLLDEAHHLLTVTPGLRSESRQAGDVGDTIKSLADGAGIACAWAGLPTMARVFDADQQLNTRWPGRFSLSNHAYDETFVAILHAFDAALVKGEFFKKESGLLSGSRPSTLHKLSMGNFRLLKMLTRRAARLAYDEGHGCITTADLERARELTFGMQGAAIT